MDFCCLTLINFVNSLVQSNIHEIITQRLQSVIQIHESRDSFINFIRCGVIVISLPHHPFIAVLHSANSAGFTKPRPAKTWLLLSKHLGWIIVEGLQPRTSKSMTCVIASNILRCISQTRQTNPLRSCPCNRAYILNYLVGSSRSNHSTQKTMVMHQDNKQNKIKTM